MVTSLGYNKFAFIKSIIKLFVSWNEKIILFQKIKNKLSNLSDSKEIYRRKRDQNFNKKEKHE